MYSNQIYRLFFVVTVLVAILCSVVSGQDNVSTNHRDENWTHSVRCPPGCKENHNHVGAHTKGSSMPSTERCLLIGGAVVIVLGLYMKFRARSSN